MAFFRRPPKPPTTDVDQAIRRRILQARPDAQGKEEVQPPGRAPDQPTSADEPPAPALPVPVEPSVALSTPIAASEDRARDEDGDAAPDPVAGSEAADAPPVAERLVPEGAEPADTSPVPERPMPESAEPALPFIIDGAEPVERVWLAPLRTTIGQTEAAPGVWLPGEPAGEELAGPPIAPGWAEKALVSLPAPRRQPEEVALSSMALGSEREETDRRVVGLAPAAAEGLSSVLHELVIDVDEAAQPPREPRAAAPAPGPASVAIPSRAPRERIEPKGDPAPPRTPPRMPEVAAPAVAPPAREPPATPPPEPALRREREEAADPSPEPSAPPERDEPAGILAFRRKLRSLFRGSSERDPSHDEASATEEVSDGEGEPATPWVGQTAALRVVGKILDDMGASFADIAVRHDDTPVGYTISWSSDGVQWEHERYSTEDLADCQTSARQQRGSLEEPLGVSLAELLRTLGQELDREGVRVERVRCERTGLHVQARQPDGHTIRHYYATDELGVLSRERRETREPPAPLPTGRPIWSFGRKSSD